jgi:hypothetical protein
MTSVSHKGGKIVLIMKRTLWKNNLKFIKDVPIIYVNFIIAISIFSGGEKSDALLLYQPFYISVLKKGSITLAAFITPHTQTRNMI